MAKSSSTLKTKVKASASPKTSDDTKLIVTVLLLVFAYPIGLIVMWVWTAWKTWVKVLVSLPILFFILLIVGGILAAVVANPAKQMHDAQSLQNNVYITPSTAPSSRY